MALKVITSHNYHEIEQAYGLSLEPIFKSVQKLETENRLVKEQNQRLKLALVKDQPGFDISSLLIGDKKQKFMEAKGMKKGRDVESMEMVSKSELVDLGRRFVDVQM